MGLQAASPRAGPCTPMDAIVGNRPGLCNERRIRAVFSPSFPRLANLASKGPGIVNSCEYQVGDSIPTTVLADTIRMLSDSPPSLRQRVWLHAYALRLLFWFTAFGLFAESACAQGWQTELAAMRQRLDALEAENARLQGLVVERLPPVDLTQPVPAYPSGLVTEAEPSLEQRLLKLESDWDKQSAAADKKRADDAKKPNQKWTGRIHTDYWAFPHTSPGANAFENGDPDESVRDRFLFRRVRIGLQGDIPDNMLYKLEVDFNTPSAVQFKDMYIGWRELPWLQTVQVGNQKRPYGLDHLNSSRYNVFMERPDIIESFNQDARRFGICSYGVSEDESWNWRYGPYMSQDLQNTGVVFTSTPIEVYQAEFAGRLANTIWYDEASGGRNYAHWAISGTAANADGDAPASSSTARFQSRVEARTSQRWIDTGVIAGATFYELAGVESLINLGPFQAVAEYQQVWMQRDNFQDVSFHGGYCYISYFLTGEHMAWDRQSGQLDRVQPFENFFLVDTCDDGVEAGWGAWQVAVRYSHADLSNQDIDGGVADEVTFGLNWYWNAYAKMQFNAIYGQIDDRRPVDGFTDANFCILGTRFLVDF
jgi:phosphate-selective porin OprO/OprP